MPTDATVFVVDDDKDVLDSLRWLIESVQLRVETFDSALAFLSAYRDQPGCLVLDIRLPGMSGLDVQEQLLQRGQTIPVIIITGHGDVPLAVRAMKAGAVDFLQKPFSDQSLLDRIWAALSHDQNRRKELAEEKVVIDRVGRLTPREVEVMKHVVEGKLNKQIAQSLGLSHKTIEVHRSRVMDKTGANSVAELVRMAIVAGIVEPTPFPPPQTPPIQPPTDIAPV